MNTYFGNTFKLALLSAIALTAAIGHEVRASETSGMAVGVSVPNNCTVSVASIDFGYYDPINEHREQSLSGSGEVTVQCTSGASAIVTLSESSTPTSTGGVGKSSSGGRLMQANQALRSGKDGSSGMSGLYYDLYSDVAMTQVWGESPESGVAHTGSGQETQLTVYGSIPGGQSVAPGNFSDTIVATVTF